MSELHAIANEVLTDSGLVNELGNSPKAHLGGTYINMEGPAFSTRAESKLHKSWGMDVIGMTNLAEARLAREAEISYNTVAMVTDFDAWRSNSSSVDIAIIIDNLQKNSANACKFITKFIQKYSTLSYEDSARKALATGLFTPIDKIPAERRAQLDIFLKKY